MKQLFAIAMDVYRASKEDYEIFHDIAACLTNFHIGMYPLRIRDASFHRRLLNQTILTAKNNEQDNKFVIQI